MVRKSVYTFFFNVALSLQEHNAIGSKLHKHSSLNCDRIDSWSQINERGDAPFCRSKRLLLGTLLTHLPPTGRHQPLLHVRRRMLRHHADRLLSAVLAGHLVFTPETGPTGMRIFWVI